MAAQERGKLNGTILLSGNTPAENISVVLRGTAYSAVTGQNGQYEIRGIKPGTYTLRVSAVGIASVENSITIVAGETLTKDFTLAESQEQLNEVIIEGKGNKFARTKSDVVAKMPLKDIENPQVYNTISAEVLKEQIVTNFDDALKNAPGLDKLWESTGRGGDGAAYYSLRGFAVQPTMRNGVPGLTNGNPDPANIDRIDVIKGPSGTLFGSSLISYGGLINVTTKRPYSTFGGNISYTSGTYGLNRTTLDINTPLNAEKKVYLRLNAAYHTEDSFQDAGFKKSLYVAPTLSYEVNDRLSFLVNAEFYNGRSTNQTMLFLDRSNPLRVHNMDELVYDNRRSYTSNDLYMDTPSFNMQAFMNYKINDKWTSQTIVSRNSAKSNGYYSYLYEGTSAIEAAVGATMPGFAITEGIILSRSTSKQDSETSGTDIQQNFIGEFNTGAVKHKFIGGLDYFTRYVRNNSTGYGNQGFVNLGVNADVFAAIAPMLNAAYGSPMGDSNPDDTGVLTQAGADAGIANQGPYYSKANQEIFSAYVSDVAYLLPNLSVMASVRIDHFTNDNGKQTAVSPKFGAVYQIIPEQLSVFGNYMNGFVNTDPASNINRNVTTVQSFDPEHANQVEFGLKADLFNSRLSGSISYFETKVKDMVYTLYTTETEDLNGNGSIELDETFFNQNSFNNGAQTNKGIEVSITANPVEGLNILAGYSYIDARLSSGDPDFVGHRPESAGPRNLANLWASYKFSTGTLRNFGLGFGGNYGTESYIFNRTLGGTFALPEYTVLNASVFYNAEPFIITLKLNNLTDEEYYKGWSTINPQAPRTFLANITYNF
ncbi:MAG: TonB-dependent siderophore receptor [Flavobacterium psychrophilum]|nr:MAG: TonB-dependent siderophore receptor [Flavobacterium psychrophilum]